MPRQTCTCILKIPRGMHSVSYCVNAFGRNGRKFFNARNCPGDPKSNESRHRWTPNNGLIIDFNTTPERKRSIIDVAIARVHATLTWKLIMCAVMVGDGQNKRDGGRGFSAQPRLSIANASIARDGYYTMISRIVLPFSSFSFYCDIAHVLIDSTVTP